MRTLRQQSEEIDTRKHRLQDIQDAAKIARVTYDLHATSGGRGYIFIATRDSSRFHAALREVESR